MAPRKSKDESPLLTALRFVQVAQSKDGALMATHCRIGNGGIVAANGIIAIGIPFVSDMPEICPHTFNLIHALERARGATSTTVVDGRMTIKANKFTAIVPVLAPHDLQYIIPDAQQYPLNDDFRDAAVKAATFTKEGGEHVVEASVLTRNGTLVGTDRRVFIEAWHGSATPPGLVLPKTFVDALEKIKKKIICFGFSDLSFTVWFDDNSWIKTQLYKEDWPPIDQVLNFTETAQPTELPKDFWEGLTTVAPFTPENLIWFDQDQLRTGRTSAVGATYVVKGLPANQCFNVKSLIPLEKITTTWDFTTHEKVAVFFGDRLRGVISRAVG